MTPEGHRVAAYLLIMIGLAHLFEAKRAEAPERETTLTLYGAAARRGCARPDHVDQDNEASG